MRILVVGAGAIGGYFGGRLLEAGRDVTFLVRAARAAELANRGLVIESALGSITLPHPPTVQAEHLRGTYDLILLSCKAYDLEGAIDSFAPAVGRQTAILPLLNGMRHLDVLDARFGRDRVLGGQCVIAATLSESRTIRHLNQSHDMAFGERDGAASDRIAAISAAMEGANFNARVSSHIVQEMWDKWLFLATLAGATCLMRAPVGAIAAAPGGTQFVLALLDECTAVASANGHAPQNTVLERTRSMVTAAGSPLTASMLRDIERHAPIEADHIIGDLIHRGRHGGSNGDALPLLRLVYTNLCAYEARRKLGAAKPAA